MLRSRRKSGAEEAERYYAQQAPALLDKYEIVTFDEVHADLARYLPTIPGIALDVGAGSGRDAAWLASQGWQVVAAEPLADLREGGRRLHPDARIEWIDDRLPTLQGVRKLGRKFELLLLSAVWMHVAPASEETALAALTELSAPKAILSISVRTGGNRDQRGFYPTNLPRLRARAARNGFSLVSQGLSIDRFGRQDVAWNDLIFQLV